jgi:hypothetical protein
VDSVTSLSKLCWVSDCNGIHSVFSCNQKKGSYVIGRTDERRGRAMRKRRVESARRDLTTRSGSDRQRREGKVHHRSHLMNGGGSRGMVVVINVVAVAWGETLRLWAAERRCRQRWTRPRSDCTRTRKTERSPCAPPWSRAGRRGCPARK